MRTNIIKNLLAIMLTLVAMPMVAQDCMNIFFKDGDFRKFYMKNITEIAASKVDAEGVMHGDYDYQRITTIYDTYIYRLEDVDSITFTKIDEKLAERNFVSAMPEVFKVISACESISDVEGKIDQIKNVEGVADAWSDGHDLYVAIAEGEIFSFHFNHDALDGTTLDDISAQIKAMMPRIESIAKKKGTQLKAVIANQRHKDEEMTDIVQRFFMPLVGLFQDCGIDVTYVAEPTIEFFYDNSDDAEHLNIYDYDIIFLITHGNYGPILYYRPDENDKGDEIALAAHGIKGHSFVTAEDIEFYDNTSWDINYATFKKWRDNSPYRDLTDVHVNYSFNKEIRDGHTVWVAHPKLTEYFFRDIAQGEFKNSNSILFNSACKSLKGDKDNHPSFSFANILIKKRHLGTYAGYTESNWFGPVTGTYWYTYLLCGQSIEQSTNELYDWCREETIENIENAVESFLHSFGQKSLDFFRENPEELQGAELKIIDKSGATPSKFFLFPTTTVEVNNDLVNQNFLTNQVVTLEGYTTHLEYSTIETGFEWGENRNLGPESGTHEGVKKEMVNNELGKYRFELTIPNMVPGKTYYYRAYTYDGLHHNYGETYAFTTPKELTLSSTEPLSLEVGEGATVDITSGNGTYSVESSNEGVAKAYIKDEKVVFQAIGAGTATIKVTDDKSGKDISIGVTVTKKDIPADIETFTVNGVSFNMVVVEGGTFMMGASDNDTGAQSSESPQLQVTLSSFLIGQTEVTQELWEAVMGTNPSYFSGAKQLPVEQVSWYDCQMFIAKLNQLTGKTFSLPTDAEWEFAARGGNKSKGYTYSGSNIADDVAWYKDNSKNRPHLVGTKAANELGLYDMSGNVWEWCQDYYGDLSSGAQVDPTGPSNGTKHVLRSGSWNFNTTFCESCHRNSDTPDHTASHLGFRLALSNSGGINIYQAICPDDHHPHMIDLGLPSGNKWACCNVDAITPEDKGGFYAWGETEERDKHYSWENYSLCTNGRGTSFKNIGSNISGTEYDVAHVKWGGEWQMPTISAYEELKEICSYDVIDTKGGEAVKITGPNGNHIIIPFAGSYKGTEYRKGYMSVWLDEMVAYDYQSAWLMQYYSGSFYYDAGIRYIGIPVRPVVFGKPLPAFSLGTNQLKMKAAEAVNVKVITGSGDYGVESSAPSIATACVKEASIRVNALSAGTADITVTDNKQGETLVIRVTVTGGNTNYLTCPDNNHPHTINLGLPSGTLWSCCNVDANVPEEFGGHYAWGETEAKSDFNWSNYVHCDGSKNTCHNLGSNISGTNYDVAHVKWGGTWQMPSDNQIEELIKNCSHERATIGDVKVMKFTGPNGGVIYIPIEGDNNGYYWSGHAVVTEWENYESNILSIDYGRNNPKSAEASRFNGCSIRPVMNGGEVPDISIASDAIEMWGGEKIDVKINSGSGQYSIISSNPKVATASITASSIKVTALAPGFTHITITDTYNKQTATVIVQVKGMLYSCPDDNHPHMLDLGLSSGTKWSCCNVGAKSPEGYGGYYAWGETEEKSDYSWETYSHCDGTKKTCSRLLHDISGTEYDVAHVKWGGEWKMPSYYQQEELFKECTFREAAINGVRGLQLIGPNGGSIFIPHAGLRINKELGEDGYTSYNWIGEASNTGEAHIMLLYDNMEDKDRSVHGDWAIGCTVRPVAE